MRIQVITALLIVVGSHFFAPTALAATFNVTSTSCAGPASLSEAIRAANVTSGADTIEIASGLTIRGDCDMGVLPDDSMLLVTESVTINGNGSTLHGANAYVDQAGSTNPYSGVTCPSNAGRAYILMGVSPSLLQVGERSVDNAGVDLTISNFNINSLSQLAAVRQGASLTLKDVKADNISDLQYCFRSAIEAFDSANVTLENVEFRGARGYDRNALGHISGQDGKLEIYDSLFALNDDRYAVAWEGNADIVTSSFTDSGGLWASGSGTMRVINSLFRPKRQGTTLDGWDGFLVNLGGRLEFEASTVLIHVNECPVRNDRGNCNVSGIRGSTATFFSNNNSVIDFKQSAIHVQTLNPIFSPSQTSLLEASNGGAFTADQYTFIQPLGWQDASALNALVTTAGGTLITGPGALPTVDQGLGAFAFNFPEDITPIVAGPLEGAIPNADTTNLLKDPRGSDIDFDILGASRNTGPTRSIGAVEGGPLYLAARIEPSTPFTADLSWSKPLSATGYDLCQGVGTPPSGLAGTTTACTSNFTPYFSTNRDTVSGRVSNLPPDSETHWFLVRATDSGTPGLWSNVQVVTVPVTITYPPTVIGTSNLVSPVVTGLLVNPTYIPLLGALPSGFTLDSTSGALSRTATEACTPTVIGILVIAGSGDVTSTAASFTCPIQPVPTMPLAVLLGLIIMLLFVGWRSIALVSRNAN